MTFALWLWAGLVYVWDTNRINYMWMLELDPRYTATIKDTLWLTSGLSIVQLASLLIHFKVLRCAQRAALAGPRAGRLGTQTCPL